MSDQSSARELLEEMLERETDPLQRLHLQQELIDLDD